MFENHKKIVLRNSRKLEKTSWATFNVTGGPPLKGFSLPWIPLPQFWVMYAKVGDFSISMETPTVPLMQSPKIREMRRPSVLKRVSIFLDF